MSTPTQGNKRLLPEDLSPPKQVQKRTKERNTITEGTVCSICDDIIKVACENSEGDDVVYCEGFCQAWSHRKCAGLSKQIFKVVWESEDPFLCPYCSMACYQKQIADLSKEVESLNSVISQLKGQDSVHNTEKAQSLPCHTPSRANPTDSVALSKSKPNMNYSDKKFNVVVYGIKESPPETKREIRTKNDLDNLISSLSDASLSIEPDAIKDSHRLGKYKSSNKQPRPLLVKFLRSTDASNVLRNKSKLSPPVYIKPDLTPEEKAKESMLLKERRSLIEQGVNRKQIKLLNNSILVSGKPHCQVEKSELKFNPTSPYAPTLLLSSEQMSTSPTVTDEQSG